MTLFRKESCQVVAVAGSGQVWARGLVVRSSSFCLGGCEAVVFIYSGWGLHDSRPFFIDTDGKVSFLSLLILSVSQPLVCLSLSLFLSVLLCLSVSVTVSVSLCHSLSVCLSVSFYVSVCLSVSLLHPPSQFLFLSLSLRSPPPPQFLLHLLYLMSVSSLSSV